MGCGFILCMVMSIDVCHSWAVGAKGAPLQLPVAIILHIKENVTMVLFDLQLTNATKFMVILLAGKGNSPIRTGDDEAIWFCG